MKNSIYDDIPLDYSELRKGWMFYEKIEIFLKFINKNNIKNCLEFGSGTGDFLSAIKKQSLIECTGYDINEKYIKYSKNQNTSILFTNNFDELLNTHYDVIYINDVIHHFDSEKDFVNKIQKINFRFLFIIEPNQFNPYISFFQYKTIGERNFIQSNFEKEIIKNNFLSILTKGFKFIFPNSIKKKNKIMDKFNIFLQNNFLLGGAVFYIIENKNYEK